MLAMTLMVRDEADVIRAMLEHSFAQGIDLIIATDNGSIDGTTEILEEYARNGRLILRHDPVHMKQQHTTVSQMARDASTEYHADWVINADADEFWQPAVGGRTLGQIFAELPTSYRAVLVPVYDMTGPPAISGTGLQRLLYRDLRPVDDIRKLGLHGHATSDTVHVGDPDVEVAQGNHLVNFSPEGTPPRELQVEVQHFPWRSWEQFDRKVSASGRAYESNRLLRPSANHHGMKDYSRWKLGSLFSAYIARHPTPEQLEAGIAAGHFVRDDRVALSAVSPVPDVPIDVATIETNAHLGRIIIDFETRLANATQDTYDRMRSLEEQLEDMQFQRDQALAELHRQRSRRVVRILDRLGRMRPGHADPEH